MKKISLKSIELIKSYTKSHNLRIPDAIIAATAISLDYPLFTFNVNDFKFIPTMKLYEINI